MAKLNVIDVDGRPRQIEAEADGQTICNILIEQGFDVGVCGGNCACGTCCAVISEQWAARLPAPSAEELGMVSAAHDGVVRRLTCQIAFDASMDGIELQLSQIG